MTISLFSPHELILFLLVMVRISATVLSLPFLGARNVPALLKILFIFLLSFGLYPTLHTQGIVLPSTLGQLGLLILGELAIGLLLGFVVQILFTSIRFGGELISQQIGLSLANLFDPQNSQPVSIISQFHYTLAALFFFTLHAHHWFIYAMAESLHRIPLLGLTPSQTLVTALLHLVNNLFVMAIKIGAPVLSVLLLSTLALGIIARLVPQMNVFILSLPVSLSVGLLVLGFSLPYLVQRFQTMFSQLGREMFLIIRLMGVG